MIFRHPLTFKAQPVYVMLDGNLTLSKQEMPCVAVYRRYIGKPYQSNKWSSPIRT
jgi:hypothetical protein